ncbi:hypothetical protein [Actinoplanes solisilvae]|uniref:hypothetical protein n=1 Tax=Actinoplanes solisilvae TaxID=2486853 RepID=UPI000FD885DD|nr:hypothetical protein [Actinoplanes solisilvae]
MNEQPHQRQLREVFELIEHNTPDPAAVYARVEELSQRYKRRRRGAQIAVGGVLSAGLIAGVVNLPAFLPTGPGATATLPAAAPSADPEKARQEQLAAYDAAGYGYDNAVELAKLWNQGGGDTVSVKAEAGRRLLLGETLPIKPSPDKPADEEQTSPDQNKQFEAFFNAGYVFADAEKLADIWKLPGAGEAKLEAGKRLLAGQDLPVKPKPANVATALEGKRIGAFFDKGYDSDDAAKLADLWHLKSPYQAKVEGGKRLLAGQTLPIQP